VLKPELRRGWGLSRRAAARDERGPCRRARRPDNCEQRCASAHRDVPSDFRRRRGRTRRPVGTPSSASRRRSLARPGDDRGAVAHPHDDRRTGRRREGPRAACASLQKRHEQSTGAAGAADTRENPHAGAPAAARRRSRAGGVGSVAAIGTVRPRRGLLPALTAEVLLGSEQPVGLTARPQENRPPPARPVAALAAEARRGECAELRPRSRGRGSPATRACHRVPAPPGDAPMGVWLPFIGWVPGCRSDVARVGGQEIPRRPTAP
jgi:hypothetical protein